MQTNHFKCGQLNGRFAWSETLNNNNAWINSSSSVLKEKKGELTIGEKMVFSVCDIS